MKPFLIVLGLLAMIMLVGQLVMGLLILNGGENVARLIKTHQHSGYAAVGVSILYIALSLVRIGSTPSSPRGEPLSRA